MTVRQRVGIQNPASPTALQSRHRVLMVNSTLHIGGAEKVAASIAQHIDSRRFRMMACYLKEPGIVADRMERVGVEIVPIPGLQPGRRDYLSFLKLRRLILGNNVQLIHTHDIHGLMDGAACRLTCGGLKHVHTFHFGNYPNISARYRRIEALLWRVPDAVVAVGHAQAAAIRRLYRIPSDRMRVIWNGVEEPSEQGSADEFVGNLPAGTPIIASISTLIPQKGLEHLLDAAAELRKSGDRFLLLVAGEGMLRDSLQRRAHQLGLADSVRFLGWVPNAAERLLPRCDIFVQSSLWEAMSVVVLEAMAAGKAMVVTSVGENSFVVSPDETGLIVPPADSESLAAGLRRLLREPELAARLGAASRLRYQASFGVRQMVSSYERLYDETIENGGGS